MTSEFAPRSGSGAAAESGAISGFGPASRFGTAAG